MRIATAFPIGPASVVFDLGAYKGQWSNAIYQMYRPILHAFEPVPAFWRECYGNLPRQCSVHPFGLGAKAEVIGIKVAADASSAYLPVEGPVEPCRIVEVGLFLEEAGLPFVDLVKVNIEGAEYDLFDHLLATGLIRRFGTLLVQFHKELPDAQARYDAVATGLDKTHRCVNRQPFIWETWEPKQGWECQDARGGQ